MNFIVVVGSPFPEIQNYAKSDLHHRPLIIQIELNLAQRLHPKPMKPKALKVTGEIGLH